MADRFGGVKVEESPGADRFGGVRVGTPPPVQPKQATSLQSVLSSLTNEFLASFQGTTPVITSDRPVLGELKNFDFGPGFLTEDGEMVEANTDDHVILRDPNTDKIMVFERTEGTNAGSLEALGRLLGFGTLAGPVGLLQRGTAASRRVEEAATAGIDTNMAAATQNRAAKVAQNTVGEVPLAGGAVSRQAERIPQQAATKVDEIASAIGSGDDAAEAGGAVRRGAESFVGTSTRGRISDDAVTDAILRPTRANSFHGKADALYQRAFDALEGVDSVDMRATLQSLVGASERFDNADLGRKFVNPKLKEWATIIADAGGKLSLNDLRQLRTELGSMLSRPSTLNEVGTRELKAVYGALSKDMARAAVAVGPDAANAVKRADQFYRAGQTRISEALKELTAGAAKSDENLFQTVSRLTGGNTANVAKLRKIRRSLPDEEWDVFVSTFLRDMGAPKAGAADLTEGAVAFSVDTFVTNYARLSKPAKEIMFAGRKTLGDGLNALAKTLSAQKEVSRTRNTSGTARNLISAGIGAGAVVDMVSTGMGLVAATTAAQLMTSQRFVAWWVKGAQATSAASHLEKLNLVAKGAEPDLRRAIDEFRTLVEGSS